MYPSDTFTFTVIWSKIEGTRSQCVSVMVNNSSRLGKGLKKGICLGKGGIKKSKGNLQNSNSSILLARCHWAVLGTSLGWVLGGKVFGPSVRCLHWLVLGTNLSCVLGGKVFGMSDQCLHWVVFGTCLGWVLGGKVLARVFSVYTGLCWVQVWVESWVVKFWHKCSVLTLGFVGYTFWLSLGR